MPWSSTPTDDGSKDTLYDDGTHAHLGNSEPGDVEPSSWHAVLIIGWRTEPRDSSTRYLIQNWWTTKQFFEVDLAFLVSRSARLAWVNSTTFDTLPPGTAMCPGPFGASAASWGTASCPDPRTR